MIVVLVVVLDSVSSLQGYSCNLLKISTRIHFSEYKADTYSGVFWLKWYTSGGRECLLLKLLDEFLLTTTVKFSRLPSMNMKLITIEGYSRYSKILVILEFLVGS
jgi:hypothetical protein